MKRRKILVLIPMLGLFLTGCTFEEGFATVKSFIGQNIYHPAKDFIEGLIGKKDNNEEQPKEDEQKPSEDSGSEGSGDQTEVKYTVKFEAGGGSGSMADVADVKGEYVLPACTFTAPEGKEFAGWQVGDEVKAAGEKITVSADVTLVATWKDKGEEVLTSIEDVYAAAVAAEGTATTQAYTFQGVVTGTQGNSFYLQENGHGMLVYNYAIEGIALGKIVKVTAKVKTYNGLPETDSVTAGEIVGDGELPTPLSISSLAGIGDANVLASVAEATFKSKDAPWASNKASLAVFVIGEDEVTVKFDKFGYDADKAAILNAATDGQKFVLNKVLTSINGEAKQLGFAGTSEIAVWTDPNEIDHFGTVTGLPESVEVGGTISNSSVDVEVFYVGGESGIVHPSDIQFDNSKEAENVPVTLKYGELTIPGTYTVNVVPSTETITPLADVYAAGVATNGGESTEEYTYQGVVTGKQGTSFYIQDGADGMYIYAYSGISPSVGDLVKIKSTVSSYNGSPQSKTVKSASIISSGNDGPTPLSISGLSDIGNAHVLASVAKATFRSKDAAWASNKASVVDFTIGSDTIKVKFDKYGYDADKATLLNGATDGDEFILSNIFTAVNGETKQLGFAGTSLIEEAPVEEKTIKEFGEVTGPASIKEGTLPSLEDINIAVTYSDDTPGSVHPTGLVEFDNETPGEVEVTVKYGDDEVGSFILEVVEAGSGIEAWTKSTSVEVGDTVVMACAAKNQYLTGISTTSTKYGLGTTMPSPFEEASYKLTVVSGASTGTVAFKTSDSNYLTWLSGNSLNVSSDLDANSSWNLTYSAAGNAQIVNSVQDNSKDRQIWWNDSATRFACYTDKTEETDGYSAIQLYTKQTVEEVAVSSIAFDAESYEVEEGQKISVTAHVNSDATNQNIVYSLASTTLATINAETGELTTTGHGTVTVTATSAENAEFNVSTTVTITEKVVPVVDGTYTLLTDPTVLTAGDKIIIANSEKTYGLKAYDSGNNCKGGAIVDTSGELTNIGEACELVLEDAGSGRFYLKSGELYLYAASSSGNQLKGKSSKDDSNGVWEITVSGDDMEIKAYGSSNRNLMRFNPNNGSPIFSCYSSTPKDGSLCKVYRLVK